MPYQNPATAKRIELMAKADSDKSGAPFKSTTKRYAQMVKMEAIKLKNTDIKLLLESGFRT